MQTGSESIEKENVASTPTGTLDNPNPTRLSATAPGQLRVIKRNGTVVPDEAAGPYAIESYHKNIIERHRGYKNDAGYVAWHEKNAAIMAKQTSWGAIDFEAAELESLTFTCIFVITGSICYYFAVWIV